MPTLHCRCLHHDDCPLYRCSNQLCLTLPHTSHQTTPVATLLLMEVQGVQAGHVPDIPFPFRSPLPHPFHHHHRHHPVLPLFPLTLMRPPSHMSMSPVSVLDSTLPSGSSTKAPTSLSSTAPNLPIWPCSLRPVNVAAMRQKRMWPVPGGSRGGGVRAQHRTRRPAEVAQGPRPGSPCVSTLHSCTMRPWQGQQASGEMSGMSGGTLSMGPESSCDLHDRLDLAPYPLPQPRPHTFLTPRAPPCSPPPSPT